MGYDYTSERGDRSDSCSDARVYGGEEFGFWDCACGGGEGDKGEGDMAFERVWGWNDAVVCYGGV